VKPCSEISRGMLPVIGSVEFPPLIEDLNPSFPINGSDARVG